MAERHEREQNGVTGRVMELDAIDPAAHDGLYWARFHREVMRQAGAELARRREAVQVTISEALSGWARTVVPVAAVAAALAGVVLVQGLEHASAQVVVDSLDRPLSLDDDLEADFTPALSAAAIAENF